MDTEDVIDISSWTQEFQKDRPSKTTARPDTRPPAPAAAPSAAKPRPAPAPTAAAPRTAPSPKTTPAPSSTASPAQSGFPVLIIVGGPGSGKKLPLVPMTMTVGREHDNNIELKDEDVARYHARISFQRGQYVLEDLESSTGTWVNDERITEAVLKQGDRIRVGATELVIDFE
jgi:pSer/pThr/pTyr-binding forkhead associated (FHA) protein